MGTLARASGRLAATARPQRLARGLLVVLARLLALLVLLLLFVPVVLLPLTTAVSWPAWLLLALADAALLVGLFWFHWSRRAAGTVLGGALIVVLLGTAASQVWAATPPIVDGRGHRPPKSIASLEKVSLNGSEQWITLRGTDVNNPVLLNLGMGGPGGGGFATRSLFEPLESHYVVVSWDEPGTGKSYGAVPFSALTPERYIEDAHALAQLLRARFHQDKIYVYGVSWTSILGVWLVQRYPDLFYAYIGNGQMVNTTEDDQLGYRLALDYLRQRGDTAALQGLERNGPPPYTGSDLVGKYLAYFDVLNDYMGSPRYAVVVPIVPFMAPEYGLVDKINHTRGLIDTFQAVYPQLQGVDFETQAARLEVPVYIFAGRNDVNAMSSLVERYFRVLQAPHKELIWLDGGHGLGDENLGQFVDIMVNKVLPQTLPAAAR